jgi:hypothetical protein
MALCWKDEQIFANFGSRVELAHRSGCQTPIDIVCRRRISRNLGLPDFRKLVQYIASQMGVSVSRLGVSDYAVIAEAYLVKNGKLGALRSWMDTTWHPSHIQIEKSQLHSLIVDLDFPIIYTTNYDRWLEKAFEKRGKLFHKIANMADLAAAPDDQTHIIKFHGDFEDDESLVLTEASYFQRMIFESPLDIRLRSDCLARPILFVGYSLQDVNTRYLLFRLQELWRTSAFADQRPLSYIVMTERKCLTGDRPQKPRRAAHHPRRQESGHGDDCLPKAIVNGGAEL